MEIGLQVALISVLWVIAEGALAYRDGMLTSSQMLQRHRSHKKGLPFLWHGGMWGDLFLITPILAMIVSRQSDQWLGSHMISFFCIGMCLSAVMHMVYTQSPTPDPLAWKEGISPAGWMHLFYQGASFAIIGLFFFYARGGSPDFLIGVSLLLVLHVAIANHILLGWLVELGFPFPWCPNLIHKPDPWVTTAVASVAVIFLACVAGGVQVGMETVGHLFIGWVFGGALHFALAAE